MTIATMGTLTSSGEIDSVMKSTVAVDKYNDEDFSETYNLRMKGLYSFWNNSVIFQGKPKSTYNLPLDVFIDKYEYNFEDYMVYTPDTHIYNYYIKSLWQGLYDVQTIQNAIQYLQEILCIRDETAKSEEILFITKYFLSGAVNQAVSMIQSIFSNAEINTNLYIDHDDPQYKFLNITIKPLSLSDVEIESLLDKFDELQKQFLTSVDRSYSSRITFYLDIS
jgi:hypothetical protein